MSIKRKQYSGSFKAKVALAALREAGTLAQLSSKYGVNANMISKWKLQALQNMAQLFDKSAALKIPISAASNRVLRDFFLRTTLLNIYGFYLPLSISGASSQVLRVAL